MEISDCINVKKVISFSLYGDNPKYCIGAIKNAVLAKSFFPDFICFYYVDGTVPLKYIEQLEKQSNSKVIVMRDDDIPKRMWRFLPADDITIDCFISRDVDSRLSYRESVIIKDWLNRKEHFINIKDNPLFHKTPEMLAGMWGMKCLKGFEMYKKIIDWISEKMIFDFSIADLDQQFLTEIMYPTIQFDCAYYDDFNSNNKLDALKIPAKRNSYRFIGEIFDENDVPTNHWKLIRDERLKTWGYFGKKISAILWKLNK